MSRLQKEFSWESCFSVGRVKPFFKPLCPRQDAGRVEAGILVNLYNSEADSLGGPPNYGNSFSPARRILVGTAQKNLGRGRERLFEGGKRR